MMFAAPGAVPPIGLFEKPMLIPLPVFANELVPSA
jgi:hypothetical protein